MSFVLEFLPEAFAEVECVTGDYEARSAGVGARFRSEVEVPVPRWFSIHCFGGCARQAPRRSASEQSLPGQAQDGVVLRARPGKIAPLDLLLGSLVLFFSRAAPEPGQNSVHGQIGNASNAE